MAQQALGLQLIRESIDAERLRRRSAAQGLRERIKTEAGRETKRIKDELKHASADRAVEELHAAYDEAVAAREGAVAVAGTERERETRRSSRAAEVEAWWCRCTVVFLEALG